MKQKTKKLRKSRPINFLQRLIQMGLRLVFLLILSMLMFTAGKQLYEFGYDLFGEKPDDGVEITVEFSVEVGESAKMVAARLKEKGLISNEAVFLAQKFLYEKDIYAGVYQLHNNMTTLEILDVLSTPMERAK